MKLLTLAGGILFLFFTLYAERNIHAQDTSLHNVRPDTTYEGNKKNSAFRKALRSLGKGVSKTSTEMGVNANIKLARYHENNKKYDKAIEYYRKAIITLKDLGEQEQVYELEEHIASLLIKEGKLEEAMKAYNELEGKVEDTSAQKRIDEQKVVITQKIDSTIYELEDTRSMAVKPIKISLPENAEDSVAFLMEKAKMAEDSADFEQSLYYYKEYIALEKHLAEEQQAQELILLEKVNEIETRDKEIVLLKQNEEINGLRLEQSEAEIEMQRTFKQNLAIGAMLIAALSIALFLLYRNQRRGNKKLGMAYGKLKTARDNLAVAEKKIKSLLNQQVSGAVADELLASKDEHKVERRFVCVMFLDIRDFTPFAEKRDPEEIIDYQNKVFGFMIDIVNKRKGVINQILGDGFMATFGAPVSTGNDCEQAFRASKEIIMMVRERCDKNEIPFTRIGIGLHAGNVVTGNVGTAERKQYSITGSTVILASRLEQLNKEFNSSLVISKEVYDELPEELQDTLEFQKVSVKGRKEPMEVAAVL